MQKVFWGITKNFAPSLLMILIVGFVTTSQAQDLNEPNDSEVNATLIEVGIQTLGTIHVRDDIDFYRFVMPESGIVEVGMTSLVGLDWFVEVYDNEQTRLFSVNPSSGDPANFFVFGSPGQTYFIRGDHSTNFSNNPSPSDQYGILVVKIDGDLNEPNDSFSNATPLTLGVNTSGTPFPSNDDDYYRFELPQAGVAEIFLSAVDGAQMRGYLYSGDQEEIVNEWSDVSGSLNFTQLLNAGVYYFRVFVDSRTSRDAYTVNVSLDLTDQNEWNNSFFTATPVNPNENVVGTIRAADDIDYYQFSVENAGSIRISVLDVPPNVDMRMRLYTPLQQQIDLVEADRGTAIVRDINLLDTGTYYLSLDDWGRTNNFSANPYRLLVTGSSIGQTTESQIGDVNANNTIDAGDASLVLQSVVGLTVLSSQQRAVADVDGNNAVQAADASLILQYVVGLIDGFPRRGFGKIYALPVAAASTGEASLSWGQSYAYEHGVWHLPLSVEGDTTGLYATQLVVNYNPMRGRVVSFEPDVPVDWMVLTDDNHEGRYRVAMAGATPIAQSRLGVFTISHTIAGDALDIQARGLVNNHEAADLNPVVLKETPNVFSLDQNYPNPFNPETEITYTLPEGGFVELGIYNTLGQRVATLVYEEQDAGYYSVNWDASLFASGTYLYRLTTGVNTQTRVLTVLK